MVLSLVLKLKKHSLSLILLPLIHLFLLELFASSSYILYFVILSATLYFLNLKKLFLSKRVFLFSTIYWFLLSIGVFLLEDSLYDIYIDLDFRFTMRYISQEVCLILTLLHLFILYLLGYNREKLF